MLATAVSFAPTGTLLAVSERHGEHGVIALWNWRSGRRLASLEGHGGGVSALGFSPDGSRLASGDTQGVLKVWDIATRQERTSLQTHELGCIIQAVAFSPDGTMLATADFLDRQVRLVDAASGAPRRTLPAPENGANALAFAPHGPTLAAAGGDGTAWLWDVVEQRVLGVLRTGNTTLHAVAFSPDGRRLATGGIGGAVRLWDLAQALGSKPSDKERTQARKRGHN
jgi:WD40 repeat protein